MENEIKRIRPGIIVNRSGKAHAIEVREGVTDVSRYDLYTLCGAYLYEPIEKEITGGEVTCRKCLALIEKETRSRDLKGGPRMNEEQRRQARERLAKYAFSPARQNDSDGHSRVSRVSDGSTVG